MEQWADIRRMHGVARLSIREIARRTGLHRDTVRRALASSDPPSYRRESGAVSKLDPFRGEIEQLLAEDARIPGVRIRELIAESGYVGGKTILDDYLRDLRPRYLVRRTFQRTVYRPGEICQFDLWEPSGEVPVGRGQTRRGYVVTCALGWSRAGAGSLIFSKRPEDILWGMSRCLSSLGTLPQRAVWDRESAIHAGGGRPTDVFAALCGQLSLSWQILAARDPQAKGLLERSHRFMRSNFEPARLFACPDDFQEQLDRWFTERANTRFHRGIRAVPAERLVQERAQMRSLPDVMPDVDHRFVTRVQQQPYLRVDTNDYSLDPNLAGRRVEVRVAQRQITAVALDTGDIACAHRRSFAKHVTLTDPEHQQTLDGLRGDTARDREVEVRPLARYDELIPA